MTLITTPLFSKQDYDGNVQLLARTKDFTYLIHIKDIEYYFYIGKLPGWEDTAFFNYMRKVLDKKFTLTLTKKVDSESFVFEKQWTYLKVKGSYKDIKYLLSRESKQIKIQQNNYFLQNFTGDKLDKILPVTELYYTYWSLFEKIDKSKLKGLDYLMYDNLKYPFRYVQQTIEAVQSRYNINFQETLILEEYEEEDVQKCKYDKKIIVSINKIKQNETSLLGEHLQYYKVCMFDIENVVSKQETYEGWKRVLSQVQFMDKYMRDIVLRVQMSQNVQIKPPTYDGQMTLESMDSDYQEIKVTVQNTLSEKSQISNRCCDQNEIVCISFIISDFKGNILEKIALVRSKYEPDGEHATKVIIAQSEKELLQHVIQIIGSKDYNIIMHFNGWDFDEKMVMARMLLHGLAEEYLASFNMENELSEYDFTCQGVVKMTAAQMGMGLFQIINPLRFSFDVFQMNKRMSPAAEKLDNNSLDGLLKYYGLEGKEGVTYQQITDRFQRYLNKNESDDIVQLENDLKEVYDYCQFDSIQQTKLQTFLGLLLQQIQISVLTRVPLKTCVYNAVTHKVGAVVYDAYLKSKKMYTDVPNPFTRSFEPTTDQIKQLNDGDDDRENNGEEESEEEYDEFTEGGKKDKKYLQNKGGEVLCNETGFKQIISAIDAESMYPAQKEANNIDKSCLITAEKMLMILSNYKDFGISDFSFIKLYDMYSPYVDENIQSDAFEKQLISIQKQLNSAKNYQTIVNLGYLNDGRKTFRWQINIDGFCFQQFFFEKKNQCMPYTFVFLLQGKDLSPKAKMLTNFRVMRQAAKKQKKEAKSESDVQFYDSKQASFKLLCNSEYGANDAPFCHAFDMFESSLVTKQSRYIIQNARDMLQSPILILQKTTDMKFVDDYNKFAQQTYNNPEDLEMKILNDDIKKILSERGIDPDKLQ